MTDKLVGFSGGHGMETGGKETPVFPAGHERAGQRMKENEFNDATLAKAMAKLKARYRVEAFDVAPGNIDVPLSTRTKRGNNEISNGFGRPVDLYVSIHANANDGTWAGPGEGVEVLYYPGSTESKRAAEIALKHLLKGTPQRKRGLKPRSDLWELKKTNMPAVLLEIAYMDDPREADLLISDKFREETAEEIVAFIAEYLQLQPKAQEVTKPPVQTPKPDPRPEVAAGTISAAAADELIALLGALWGFAKAADDDDMCNKAHAAANALRTATNRPEQ